MPMSVVVLVLANADHYPSLEQGVPAVAVEVTRRRLLMRCSRRWRGTGRNVGLDLAQVGGVESR
jgi:hypothetical protein